MPSLRGPTVGRAFVLILADGSGLPKSIKDEMERAEPFAEQAGHKHSKAYGQAFADELHKGGGLEKSIQEGLGRADAIEKHFSGPEWEQTVHRLREQFGDAGVKLGHDLQEGVRRGGSLDLLHDTLGNIGPEIRRVQQEIADAFDMEEAARKAEQETEKIVKSVKKVRTEVDKNRTPLQQFADTFDEVGDAIGRAFGRGSRNDALNVIGGIMGGLIKLPGVVAKFAAAAGNVLGPVLKSLQGIGRSVTEAGQEVQEGAKVAEEALASTGKAAAEAGEGLAAAGPGGIIAAAAAIGVALLTIPVVVGAVVSAMSLLVGAATALAASLSFAVAGALAPLAGVLLPLAVGFATVALAMSVWNKENKAANSAVKKATTSVQNANKELKLAAPGTEAYAKATKKLAVAQEELATAQKGSGDSISASMTRLKSGLDLLKGAAVSGIFGDSKNSAQAKELSGIIDNISAGIKTVTPLLKVVGGGVRGFFKELATPLAGSGFQDFVDMMTKNLPGQIQKLGAIFSNTGGIIGGFFTALQPVTNKFLDTQVGLTQKFSEWINSPKGQTQMKDFFDKAWTSANLVWDIIKQITIDLGKLFSAGKDTGDNLLESILGWLEGIGRWLDENPSALQDWFDQAEEAGHKVGDIVNAVTHLIDTLDEPENRARAQKLFKAIETFVVVVEGVLVGLEFAWDVMVDTIMNSPIGAFLKTLELQWDALAFAWHSVVDSVLSGIHGILVTFKTMVDAFAKAPGPIGAPFRALQGPINAAISKVEDLQSQAAKPMKPVITPVITDYQATVDKLNHLTELANIPREVIIGVQAKIKGGGAPVTAGGGIFSGAQPRIIGEAGREAVVPLDRPLAQVDPAVRSLSAFAQGLPPLAGGGVGGASKVINVGGLTVITPTEDPFAVASETVNRLVGAAYI